MASPQVSGVPMGRREPTYMQTATPRIKMMIELTNAATCTSLVNAITFYAGACLSTSRVCEFLLVQQPGAETGQSRQSPAATPRAIGGRREFTSRDPGRAAC